MGKFIKGEVVIFPFPYTDLQGGRRRPSFVIRSTSANDLIVCPITKTKWDPSVLITKNDFKDIDKSIGFDSYVKVSNIFTIDESLILYSVGSLKNKMVDEIIDNICDYIKGNV